MGSLPNLNELRHEKHQRRATAERERDAVRERAQQLEYMRRDQLPSTLLQVKEKKKTITKFIEKFYENRHYSL